MEKICKNCRWWEELKGELPDYVNDGNCINSTVYLYAFDKKSQDPVFVPEANFGCNQWEGKDNG